MKRCFDPWRGLVVSYNHRSWVNCCVYAGVSDVWDDTPDIRTLWNTPWFQILREEMASGKLKRSGCIGCNMLNDGLVPQPQLLGGLTAEQEENARLAATHWKNGDTVLESTPMELFLTFTAACNLKCIMCSQEDVRAVEKYSDLNADVFLEQEDVLKRALKVWVSGGEPLVSRECVRFIKEFADKKQFRNTCLSIVTNGLLLESVLDDFAKLNKLELIISSDGMGAAYEVIRKGGKWESLRNNIDNFIKLRNELNRPGWTLSINYIVMRETLPCLPEFLEFALSRGIDKVLPMGLDPTRETFEQDIYRNPEALAAVPGWKDILEQAIAVCNSYGNADIAAAIENIRMTLGNVKEVDKSVYPSSDPMSLLNSAVIRNKKILVWGTGGHYRSHYANWVRESREVSGSIQFVDNDDSKWGSIVDGCLVYSPDKIASLEPDLIVLAVTRQFRDVIRDQIVNDLRIEADLI